MKKVILLTDFYFPHNNANGLCIGRIGNGLLKMGYEVHVIAYSDSSSSLEDCIDGIYVHRVKPAFFYKMRSYYFKHSSHFVGKMVWFLHYWIEGSESSFLLIGILLSILWLHGDI